MVHALQVLLVAIAIKVQPNLEFLDYITCILYIIIALAYTMTLLKLSRPVTMMMNSSDDLAKDITNQLRALPYVVRVEDLKIWPLTFSEQIITCSILIANPIFWQRDQMSAETTLLKYNFMAHYIQLRAHKRSSQMCINENHRINSMPQQLRLNIELYDA